MNSYLLNRDLGSINPQSFQLAQTSRLVHTLEPVESIKFNSALASNDAAKATSSLGQPKYKRLDGSNDEEKEEIWAHKAGVNVLAVDQNEGRYMITGGADPTLHVWDLESRTSLSNHTYKPTASLTRSTPSAHTHAYTSLSIYPFDPTPSTILTTSYDTTLKLTSITPSSLNPVHTFSLDSTPYCHSFSNHPSSTLLIATGTSHPAVRLLDLRSGLATHALPGHTAPIYSLSWSPRHPHVLASASADHRVLLFDVRRAGSHAAFGSLDLDDAMGVVPDHTTHYPGRPAFDVNAKAHNGPVNGVRWTEDGDYIITCGHDQRIRVWDAATGKNELVHFGPRIRNARIGEANNLLVTPRRGTMAKGKEVLFWANEDEKGEIFMFDLHEGEMLRTLRVPGVARANIPGKGAKGKLGMGTDKKAGGRINALGWRVNAGSGAGVEMYSAHGDGMVRAWGSHGQGADREEEDAEEEGDGENALKRKRDVLGEIYDGLTKRQVTFT